MKMYNYLSIFDPKTIACLFMLACVTAASAQTVRFPPSPQSLDSNKKVDVSDYKVCYTFKYKLHPDQEDFLEDRRIVQIGRRIVKDFSESVFHYDSLATVNFKKGLDTPSNTETPYPFELYNNYKSGVCETKYRMLFYAGTLVYSSPLPKLNWELAHDKPETLFGHKCDKATTRLGGRDYTAWFATDIPISSGPYKFAGLPGLILKVEEADKMFVWELASFRPAKEDIFVYRYEHEQKTTPEGAGKILKRMMTKPYEFLADMGVRINVRGADGNYIRKTKDDVICKYEPIEVE